MMATYQKSIGANVKGLALAKCDNLRFKGSNSNWKIMNSYWYQ